MDRDSLKKNIEENLFRLRRLRDQIRLDVHLAGMEARSRWERLEPTVEQAEKLAEDISEVSRKALAEMVERFRDFAETVRRDDRPHA